MKKHRTTDHATTDHTTTDNPRQAYDAGKTAYQDGTPPLNNPHTPAPPGNITLARLWRQGWQAARRQRDTDTRQ